MRAACPATDQYTSQGLLSPPQNWAAGSDFGGAVGGDGPGRMWDFGGHSPVSEGAGGHFNSVAHPNNEDVRSSV